MLIAFMFAAFIAPNNWNGTAKTIRIEVRSMLVKFLFVVIERTM
jgi:hypothetical protein